jgi:hypothetical protein
MTYGLVFWGNSILAIQFSNCKIELLELWWGLEIESCGEYFRKLKILPLQSQYIQGAAS